MSIKNDTNKKKEYPSNKMNEFDLMQLLKVENFDAYSELDILNHLSRIIDLSFDLRSLDGIQKAIQLIDLIDVNGFSSEQKSIFYYFTANAWCNQYSLKYSDIKDDRRWDWTQIEIEKAIYFYRLAIKEEGFNKLDSIIRCNIFTNLANEFDSAGRIIDAIEYWHRALEIDPNFGMALGNLGLGLYNYGLHLYDPGHQCLLINKAREYLILGNEELSTDINYRYAACDFKKVIRRIDENKNNTKICNSLEKTFSLGRTNTEREYRGWCLNHNLFLNPLNDLGEYSIAARDIISVPNIVTPLNIGPKYQGFYNQIKQEFVSARYMYFEGIREKRVHFSDRNVLLYNTLDYPCYCIAIEKIKMAYRTAYSLFDKIGFFINDYFSVGENPQNVYFKTIWFQKDKTLRSQFENKRNLPLRGLFWLSKDLYNNPNNLEGKYINSVEPDAEQLYDIRNSIEHKYLKVHDALLKSSKYELKDDLAFSIQRNDLELKTLKLLKLVRNALIYLTLAIHSEELERMKKRSKNVVIVPMINSVWDDRWKI